MNTICIILIVIAGLAKGLMDRLLFHYHTIPKSWNSQYWDPRISWTNKYEKMNIIFETVLVWTTDGYHMLQMVFLSTLFVALLFFDVFTISDNFYINVLLNYAMLRLTFWFGFKITYR